MRRGSWSVLVAVALVSSMASAAPAEAVTPAATHFDVFVIADEGPPPASGSHFDYEATLVDQDQQPVAGVPVTLSVKPYGSPTFQPSANGVSDAQGTVHLGTVLTYSSSLRWSWPGDAAHSATTSPSIYQAVGSRVRAHVRDSTLRTGQRAVVLGGTGPIKPGSRVSLWRGDKPAFAPDLQMTRIAVGVVRADGTFRLTAGFARPGARRLYVKVNAGKGNAEAYSKYLLIHVR